MIISPNMIILRDRKVLLLRRASWAPLFPGYWHCPIGKMEAAEAPHETAIRETYEEVGLQGEPSLGAVVAVKGKNFHNPEALYQDISLFFILKNFQGEPFNKEPRLHTAMEWFDVEHLPEPIIPVVKFGIQQYLKGEAYGEFNDSTLPQVPHTPSCEFKKLSEADIPLIVAAFEAIGWNKPRTLYEGYLREQEAGDRLAWLAFKDNQFAGYVTLKKHSDYPGFRDNSIPEIADLNVLPSFRNQGIGTALLQQAEVEARKTSSVVGIGVGLTADYGSAQRLYIRQGYVPDGQGATSHGNPLAYGEKVLVDDDLVLWARKKVR